MDAVEKQQYAITSWLRGYSDVSIAARRIGFVCPVALSDSAWRKAVETPSSWENPSSSQRAKERRLLTILVEALQVARSPSQSNAAVFTVSQLVREKVEGGARRLRFVRTDFLMQCVFVESIGPVVVINIDNSKEEVRTLPRRLTDLELK